MEINERIEFVVIVKLSDEHAKKLNSGNIKGVCLEVRCDNQGFRELNCDKSIHGSINSRIFYAQDVEAGTKCQVLLLDRTDGREVTIACENFEIPNSKEYYIAEKLHRE